MLEANQEKLEQLVSSSWSFAFVASVPPCGTKLRLLKVWVERNYDCREPLHETAKRLCQELLAFQSRLEADDHADSYAAIGACVADLRDEFGFDAAQASDLSRHSDGSKDAQLKAARKQLAYQRGKRHKAEEEIATILPEKQGNQIAALWYLRAGLARPTVPIAALSEFLQDFPLDSTQFIGASSLGKCAPRFRRIVGIGGSRNRVISKCQPI